MRASRLLCLFLASSCLAATIRADALDDAITAGMKEYHIPGLVVGVAKDGKTLRLIAQGIADIDAKTAITPDSKFNVGSITKSFTAATLMSLVEEGKLSIEDPVRKWIPELPESWNGVLIRHLLSHTGGLEDWGSIPGFKFANQYTDEEFVKLLAGAKPKTAPLEAYSYSNVGYSTLGLVISRVAGKPFKDMVHERVIARIGLKNTDFLLEVGWPKDVVIGYRWRNDAWSKGQIGRPRPTAPSGAITSTAQDLLSYMDALVNDKIISQKSREQMWTSQVLSNGRKSNYGFGWGVIPVGDKMRIQHSGSTVAGFRAFLTRRPDGVTIVVLTNLGPEWDIGKFTQSLSEAFDKTQP